jgi:anti-anti-sigma factor
MNLHTSDGSSKMTKNEPFESRMIDGDILAIVLPGDLDSASAPEFDRQIQGHLDAGRSKIIIDCHRMGYISSLGIASLVSLQAKLRRKGGEVKLAAIFGPAMEVMRLVRLDKMLDIYGDLEFARKSFYPKDEPAQP